MSSQTIVLAKDRDDSGRVVRFIEALPRDKAWEIEVRPYRAKRSDQQNRYWWAVVVKTLSESVGYESQEVHEHLCGSHFGWKDKRVPKTPRNPEGLESVPLRTTTTDAHGNRSVLSKMEFADLVAFAQRFGANHGIFIPDPDAEWFMKDDPKQEKKEQAA